MIPLDRVREMLAAATPGPWDAGAVNVYSTAGCPLHGPGGNPLADASVNRCVCRVVVNDPRDCDAPLIAAAPGLARDVLSLADALATAVRAERELTAEYERAWGAHVTGGVAVDAPGGVLALSERLDAIRDQTTALLSAAPAPSTVPAPLVRAYLAAQHTAVQRGATNADVDTLRTARVALDAALARCP